MHNKITRQPFFASLLLLRTRMQQHKKNIQDTLLVFPFFPFFPYFFFFLLLLLLLLPLPCTRKPREGYEHKVAVKNMNLHAGKRKPARLQYTVYIYIYTRPPIKQQLTHGCNKNTIRGSFIGGRHATNLQKFVLRKSGSAPTVHNENRVISSNVKGDVYPNKVTHVGT